MRILFLVVIGMMYSITGCNNSSVNKILYINSYHPGYPPSDEITSAIVQAFSDRTYMLKIEYMDAKQNTCPEYIERKSKELLEIISEFSPDILIVSDDNAVQSIVVPLKCTDLPIVFCGVNWACDSYGLPVENVTGMLEVLPLKELLDNVRKNTTEATRLIVVSEKSLSEENNKLFLDPLFSSWGFKTQYFFVESFDEWKEAFLLANEFGDIIYFPTNGAITKWDDVEAMRFIEKNIVKPIVTCDDFMMPFCVFGMTKVAEEQGRWAAEAAKQILNGKNVKDIPVTSNKETKIWLNYRMAEKIDFLPEDISNMIIINL